MNAPRNHARNWPLKPRCKPLIRSAANSYPAVGRVGVADTSHPSAAPLSFSLHHYVARNHAGTGALNPVGRRLNVSQKRTAGVVAD